MKQNISMGAVVAVIVIVVLGVAYFGWRSMSGGPNGDMTQENINRYQASKNQAMANKPTNREEAAKAGAPMAAPPTSGSANPFNPPASGPGGPPR